MSFGSNLSFATQLRSWGEAGVMNIRIWSTNKIYYRGALCMIVGYNHGSGAYGYSMWHLRHQQDILDQGHHQVKESLS